ncbi:MAG: glycosyltransferase family 4 protein, partial [Planctomycetota bacterium]
MRVLFIAPLPPPVNGQSVVSQRLLEHLQTTHDVTPINIRKQSLKDGLNSLERVVEVLGTLRAVARERRHVEVVYLTIAESMAGNLKDLVICLLCRRPRLRTYLHLHGGSLRRLLYDRHRSVYWLNRLILRNVAGAIVSGPSHIDVFEGVLDPGRVHIAANYAGDELFVAAEQVANKFASTAPIRILYISHMTEMKGYKRLIDAYFQSSEAVKRAIRIDFAGAFDDEAGKKAFLDAIKYEPRLRYHGVVDTESKRCLVQGAHVFALPTAFFEGQPISILEAYAAGCVVVATGQPGILDIFTPGENGYVLPENTPSGIAEVLCRLVSERDDLGEIAMRNRRLADARYRASTAMANVSGILERT